MRIIPDNQSENQSENQEIEEFIKEIAKILLQEKIMDVIIGYSKGTNPLSTLPIIMRDEKDIDKLTWD